jgi:CheY-like chemotaxis protein
MTGSSVTTTTATINENRATDWGHPMTSQQWLQLASTLVTLVTGLVWPAALVVCIFVFRQPIGEFLSNLSELSLKAAGVEASAKRGQVTAAAAVAAAEASKDFERGAEDAGARPDVGDIAEVLPGRRAMRRIEGSRVLWVDDRPQSNRYERQALEALGIRIDLSTSTDSAVEMAAEVPYRLIISDMSRPPDTHAGYTLLDALSRRSAHIPVVLYTGSARPADVAEARTRGAAGQTASPRELIAIVTEILGGD